MTTPPTPIRYHGPKPEVQFCTVCCMLAKGKADKTSGKIIELVEEAVTMGLPAIIGPAQLGGNGLLNGVVPVCWNHLLGIQFAEEGGLASPMAAPPGLLESLARGK